MERLTRKIEKISWQNRGGKPSGYTSDYTKQEVVGRLAAYENTALTPHEIERMKSIIKTLNKNKYAPSDIKFAGHIIEVAEAALAEMEGE